ncbi:MAG: hydrogenase expression/formation protein HypE [Elusimicrobia bacterium]|nr:hydrogenase expression/formation protein HypE [Elusimicrobiota bacterium]
MKGQIISPACPMPDIQTKNILLGHGSGGRLMDELINKVLRRLLPDDLKTLNDSAVLDFGSKRLAITTDSFVVDPLFFPGGDIGKLAVCGTINDLAVSGARPVALACAFILEEGLPIETLARVVESMKKTAQDAGVAIITGDTKVVNRGKCDKMFVTTTGLGIIEKPVQISADQAKPGDVVILNGDIARHGIAIMITREGLSFDPAPQPHSGGLGRLESQGDTTSFEGGDSAGGLGRAPIESDCAALHDLTQDILDAGTVRDSGPSSVPGVLRSGTKVHVMRDLTRGGLSSALNEIARSSNVGIKIYEDQIPVQEAVMGVCEILGLDPFQVANEGKLIAIVAKEAAQKVLKRMRRNPLGKNAVVIGEIVPERPGLVIMKTKIGGTRVVEMLSGEQLPRIC